MIQVTESPEKECGTQKASQMPTRKLSHPSKGLSSRQFKSRLCLHATPNALTHREVVIKYKGDDISSSARFKSKIAIQLYT